MASRVRAGLTKVDCKEATELANTASATSTANGPMTGTAISARTFSPVSGLDNPRPVSPRPAKRMVETETER